jgi:peptidylprolyl isomerase
MFFSMGSHRSQKHKSLRRKSQGKKKLLIAIGFLTVVAIIIGAYYVFGQGSQSQGKVLLKTTKGDIVIELRNDMPVTSGNFRNLVQQGVYDGTIFHRVIADFMIQGGDPTGTGQGDPSIPAIPDEFTGNNRNDRGTVAMANAGPNTGSSQFFINVVNNNYLDSKHPVFGKVIQGMDVVDAISKVATDANDRPMEDVRIIKAELVP